MACWSIKAAISLKRIKTEQKLPWSAYRKSSMLFQFFGLLIYFYFGLASTATEMAVFALFWPYSPAIGTT